MPKISWVMILALTACISPPLLANKPKVNVLLTRLENAQNDTEYAYWAGEIAQGDYPSEEQAAISTRRSWNISGPSLMKFTKAFTGDQHPARQIFFLRSVDPASLGVPYLQIVQNYLKLSPPPEIAIEVIRFLPPEYLDDSIISGFEEVEVIQAY